MTDASPLVERLRRLAGMAAAGSRVFWHSGLAERFDAHTLYALFRTAVDIRRGFAGARAIVHLHALTDPVRAALVCDEQRLNYGELEQRINRLTHGLRQLGLGPGERLATFIQNGIAAVELYHALAGVGGHNVQIGFRLKASEVAYILENSGPRALVFDGELAPVLEEALALANAPHLARERCIAVGGAPGFRSYEELLEGGNPQVPARVAGAGYGGVMVYTSGTTGRAKGAERDFRRMGYLPILDFISKFPLRHDERHLVLCPLYHSMAPAFVMMVTAVGGCCVVVKHFDPEETLRLIERERITSTLVVPTMLARILALPPGTLRKYDTSSLRWIMSGAAPLPVELARRVEETFGHVLYNFYGATETGLVTLALPGEHTARPGTIGRLVGGNRVRLLDPDGREVPDGQVGELYTWNPMIMDGYYKNPEANRAAQRDGMISVGDLAYRDRDGYYYLADRKADMVISGGVNIYPWEIEQRLHAHPAVAEAAVVGVPDAEWGESLAAFVVLHPGKSASAEDLIAWVQETLADYKRPRTVTFVDTLPRNPTGKVLKRELREQLQPKVAS
jgi:fatty-acyl-CoA synthase